MELQTNEQLWQRVDTILENAQNQNSKFFALQVCTLDMHIQRV